MQTSYLKDSDHRAKGVDLKRFYEDQAGGAIDPYVSYTRLPQKGRGFFGRLIKGSILPLVKKILPFVKNAALDGVGGLVEDMKDGMSIKEAGVKNIKKTGLNLASNVMSSIRQKGSGIRRRRRRRRLVRAVKRGKRSAARVRRGTTSRRKRKTRKLVLFA